VATGLRRAVERMLRPGKPLPIALVRIHGSLVMPAPKQPLCQDPVNFYTYLIN
jgi:hypothetical protein